MASRREFLVVAEPEAHQRTRRRIFLVRRHLRRVPARAKKRIEKVCECDQHGAPDHVEPQAGDLGEKKHARTTASVMIAALKVASPPIFLNENAIRKIPRIVP